MVILWFCIELGETLVVRLSHHFQSRGVVVVRIPLWYYLRKFCLIYAAICRRAFPHFDYTFRKEILPHHVTFWFIGWTLSQPIDRLQSAWPDVPNKMCTVWPRIFRPHTFRFHIFRSNFSRTTLAVFGCFIYITSHFSGGYIYITSHFSFSHFSGFFSPQTTEKCEVRLY